METEQSAQIVRGILSLARRLRAEQPAGSVSLAAIGILSTLRRFGPMPAVRLAAEEGLQPQSLSRLIAALDRAELIARSPSTADRREIVISITARGRATLYEDVCARRRWLEDAMSATLNEAERQILFEAAGAMVKLAGYGGERRPGPGDGRAGESSRGHAARASRPVTK